MPAHRQGEGRHRPQVNRFRTADMFGLRVRCQHGALAELVYPHREVIESWQRPVTANPCRWVPACPEYAARLAAQDRPAPVVAPPLGRATPPAPGDTTPTLANHPHWEPDTAPRYGPRIQPRPVPGSWHVEVGCADLCGATVVVAPEKVDGDARCVDCGHRYYGAAVPQRPPPGWTKTNGLRMGQGGENCYPVTTQRERST